MNDRDSIALQLAERADAWYPYFTEQEKVDYIRYQLIIALGEE